MDWRPGADRQTLQARSRLMSQLRAFFSTRDYLEVDTPLLSAAATTDPHIESIAAGDRYLHSSPEFAMKRLLAVGIGPVFQICHVFRDGEAGRLHNPEFCLLEWYRPGFDHHRLMDEIVELLRTLEVVAAEQACERLTYADAFKQILDLDPHHASNEELAKCASAQGIALHGQLDDRDAWLDLLMGSVVGSQLGLETPCFVFDYPASQAALARIRKERPPVAERFELYWRGMELANGFHELTDAVEQRRRFQADLRTRERRGQAPVPMDGHFLQALEAGLPDCAGVALGVDRLLMLMLGKTSVAEVMPLDWERA